MSLMRKLLRLILALNFIYILILALSYQFWTPDSGTRVVAVLALIPIVLSTVGAMALIAMDWTPF